MLNFRPMKGDQVLLRHIRLDDAEDMFAWASDPEVSRFLPWAPHRSIEETRQYIRECIKAYRDEEWLPLAIEDNETGRVIGNLALYAVKPRHGVAEIAFVLSRDLWGRRTIDEAASLFIGWAFQSLDIFRIQAVAAVENEHSIAVLERLGMRFEGILRGYQILHTGPADMKMYSILQPEWKEKKSE